MKFRIRSKVAAALAVPLLALVAVVSFGASEALDDASRLDEQTDLALVAVGPGSLSTALQAERDLAVTSLLGLDAVDPSLADLDAAARRVADAEAVLEALLARSSTEVQSTVRPALDALGDIATTRETVAELLGDDRVTPAAVAAVAGDYAARIDVVFAATGAIIGDIELTALRNGVEIVDATNRRNEAVTAALVAVAVDRDDIAPTGDASGALVAASLHEQRIEQFAAGDYAGVATDADRARFDDFAALVARHGDGEDVSLDDLVATGAVGDTAAATAAASVLADAGAAALEAAQDRVRFFVIGAAVAASLAILITYFATVSITRPLRALRKEAEEMATTRLPRAVLAVLEAPPGEQMDLPDVQPIPIETRDEVGDVVKALNKVQTRTLALAADQAMLRRNFADSFVNLGRRNQLLLDRQLEFITHLEAHETDAGLLDSLFQLDHLATRMRRNAESLLVLAGAGSPRQWGAPVLVSDVVRAGLGEVEHYQRVSLRALDDARMEGAAAAGVAHVVAELTENALAFSPPEETVEVKGRIDGTSYVIAIVDNGIGMDAKALEQANRRLSGAENFTVAPSRYLGHYVAGQLADQLGITVNLQANPAGGTVASITVPRSLLVAGAPEPEVIVAVPAAAASERPSEAPAPPEPVAVDPAEEAPEAVEADLADAPEPAPGFVASDLDSWLADSYDSDLEQRSGPTTDAPAPGRDDHAGALDETAPPRIDWMAADAWDGPTGAPLDAPAASEPVVPAVEPTPAETSGDGLRATARLLREASGGGGIADGGTTEAGLPRRVPGAQRPGATPLLERRQEPADAPPPAEPGAALRAAGALGFLEAFQGPTTPSDPTTEEQT